MVISDQPRFSWRGLSLDVARSFYPVEEIKLVLDLLARYRMNRLHLHLTDDQGWRLDVPAWPDLAATSGSTAVKGGRAGFYSCSDIEAIIQYAATWGVEVVLEVDIPGHTNAATHACGELTTSGKPTSAYPGIEVGFSKLYESVPATEPFIDAVFSEACRQSSGPYVHLGGDEAYQVSEVDYAHMVSRAAAEITRRGKTVVAWQEAAGAGLPAGSILQYWDPRTDKSAIRTAVNHGLSVLMSPADRTYLDMKYDASTPIGQDWAGTISLKASYDWDPTAEIPGVKEAQIAGVEAGMWTETIRTFDQLSFMLLPRLPAVTEVAWAPEASREYTDFCGRLAGEVHYWERSGYRWHAVRGVNWPDVP